MPIPILLASFGLFLMICGVVGWGTTGFSEKGKTAVLSGGLSGAIMLATGLGAHFFPRFAGPFRATALAFAALFAAVFTWRAAIAWSAGDAKFYTALLLSTMALAAAGVALTLIASALRTRP